MTKLFLNQLYFINSLIKKNSKKVQDLSFISTQQPSELLYKGGSHNHSCPAPKEFQPQKKLSVGPPSREGLNYTKNPCFFPLHWRAVVRDQCEELSIEVTGIVPLFKPREKVGADTQSKAQSQSQGAAPARGTGSTETSWLLQPFLLHIPPLPHPNPSCRLSCRAAPSPTPHFWQILTTSLLSAESGSVYFYFIQNWTGLFWNIFFFHESCHGICTPSH